MSENLKKSEIEGAPELAVGVPPLGNLSATALARRKMLLTSLGKGSAVVAAAALPLKALAATPSLTSIDAGRPQVRCTISGAQSGVHSKETITAICAGRKPSSYGVPAFPAGTPWPGNLARDTNFNVVFTSSAVTSTLRSIIQTAPVSDNAYWIAAFLNALSVSPVTNFPYTPTEVQGLFVTNPVNALNFFKTYMSTL